MAGLARSPFVLTVHISSYGMFWHFGSADLVLRNVGGVKCQPF